MLLSIVPAPRSSTESGGAGFPLDARTRITGEADAAAALSALIAARTGVDTADPAQDGPTIDLRLAPGGAARVVPDRGGCGIRRRHRRGRRRTLLRRADARPAHHRRDGRLRDPRGADRGLTALRLPRRDARRRAPLLSRRDRQGVHRPSRGTEVQRPAPAPDRRPGLAHPPRRPPEAHRARVRIGGRRRRGRLLLEGRLSADRRARGIPSHDRGPRGRPPRPHARRRSRLPRTGRGARALRAHPRDRAVARRRDADRRRALHGHGCRVLVAEDPR